MYDSTIAVSLWPERRALRDDTGIAGWSCVVLRGQVAKRE